MSVRREDDGTTIVLDGHCPVEEAEPLLQFLQASPAACLDWRQCTHLHTAVLQVILAARPQLTAKTERLSAQFAAEVLGGNVAPRVIDVRAPKEREGKHIAGSESVPLNRLSEKMATLPKDRALLVYCAGGYRSSIATSLLQRDGFQCVSEIAGGLAAWEAAGLPVAK